MKIALFAAALAVSATAPLAARADDASGTANVTSTSNYGVVICRVARSGEKTNARMINRPTTLVCKPIDPEGNMATIATVRAKSPAAFGPNLSKSLTPDQVNLAWQHYIDKTFMIDHTP